VQLIVVGVEGAESIGRDCAAVVSSLIKVGVVIDDDAADVADFGSAAASHLVAAVCLDKLVLAFWALPGNIHKCKNLTSVVDQHFILMLTSLRKKKY